MSRVTNSNKKIEKNKEKKNGEELDRINTAHSGSGLI